MLNTTFVNNSADYAGGAIFTSSSVNVGVICDSETDDGAENSSLLLAEAFDLTKTICPWWIGNTAETYGHVVASFASQVQVNVTVNERGITGSEEDGPYIYRSGSPLSISLEIRDGFDQGPAVGRNGRVVSSTISSPNSLFSGNQTILLGSPSTELNVTRFAKPGNYTVLVNFDEDILKEEEINVTVQNCTIGEASLRDGTFCEPCSSTSYNFNTSATECEPCPANGNCEKKAIVPKQGYWNSSPCSEHIQRCLTEEACDSGNRQDELAERTRDLQTCQFDNQYLQDYTEAQCREVSIVLNYGLPQVSFGSQGHEGPLCGSCKKSFGKSHSYLCEKCLSDVINVVLVVLSFFVLLGLSSITIRSNLISVFISQQRQQTQVPTFSAASASARAVPTERAIELAVLGSTTDGDRTHGHCQEAERAQSFEDTELAKLKADELYKV